MTAGFQPLPTNVDTSASSYWRWTNGAVITVLAIGCLASLTGLMVVALDRFGLLPAPLFFLHLKQGVFVSGRVVAGMPAEFWWLNGFAICWKFIAHRDLGTDSRGTAALYAFSVAGLFVIGGVAWRTGWRCATADVSAGVAVVLFLVACASPASSLLRGGQSLITAMPACVIRGGPRRHVAVICWLAAVAVFVYSWEKAETLVSRQDASDANLLRWYDAQAAKTGRRRDKIEIVAFTDYLCPYCAHDIPMASRLVHEANRDHASRVGMEIRDLPLDTSCNPFIERSIHPLACEAAAAVRLVRAKHGNAAALEMSSWLYGVSADLSAERLHDRLGAEGLLNDFPVQRAELLSAIATDVAEAASFGIRVTPTFIVNGVQLPGGGRSLGVVVASELFRLAQK